MKERLTRLETIRKLIKNYRIESQEALLGYLSREGYAVTQATLSRDLKLLKVGEVSDIVRTEYGFHIIKVTKRTEGADKPGEQAQENR